MQLKHYLRIHNLSPAQLADKLGMKYKSSIYRYLSGSRIPSLRILEMIETVTQGMVTAQDFATSANQYKSASSKTNKTMMYSLFSSNFCKFIEDAKLETPPINQKIAANENIGYPIWRAKQVLRFRLYVDKRTSALYLNGRKSTPKQVVAAANQILISEQKTAIPYPGLSPIPDKSAPNMKIWY